MILQLVIVTLVSPIMLGDSFEATGYCYTQYVHVSVVKQGEEFVMMIDNIS